MTDNISNNNHHVNNGDSENRIEGIHLEQSNLNTGPMDDKLLNCYHDATNPFDMKVGDTKTLVFDDVEAIDGMQITMIDMPGIYPKLGNKQRKNELFRNFDVFRVVEKSGVSGVFDGGVHSPLLKGFPPMGCNVPPQLKKEKNHGYDTQNADKDTQKIIEDVSGVTLALDTEYVELEGVRDAQENLKAAKEALEARKARKEAIKTLPVNTRKAKKLAAIKKGTYQTNQVLSYQIWCDENQSGLFIIAKNNDRLHLGELLAICRETWGRDKINIWSHYNLAEISSLNGARDTLEKEIKDNKHIVRGVHNSLIIRNAKWRYFDANNNAHDILWTFRDTQPIMMGGLDKVGQSVGIGKIFNPHIEEMGWLLANKPTFFFIYSMMDVIIITKFLEKALYPMIKELETGIPISGSQMGQAFAKFTLNNEFFGEKCAKDSWKELFGYVRRQTVTGIDSEGKPQHKYVWEPKADVDGLVSAYHGGRNETYVHGIIINDCYDWDFPNAYPMAMITINEMDWNRHITITNDTISDLRYDDLGQILVKYKFVDNLHYPAFAIQRNNSLVFPRQGETWVTPVEFVTAYQNGWLESYDVISAQVYRKKERVGPVGKTKPYKASKLFAQTIRTAIEQRKIAKKAGNSIQELWKLIVNGLYGKITQGINPDKKAFDYVDTVRRQEHDVSIKNAMVKGQMFNPLFASHITAVTRSLAAEFMNHLHDKGVMIVNCTTDGFQTTSDIDVSLRYGEGLWLGKILSDNRKAILGDDGCILELKHFNPYQEKKSFNLAIKTRCYYNFYLNYDGSQEYNGIPVNLNLAKGGQSTKHLKPHEVQDYLFSTYLNANRFPMKKYLKKSLSSIEAFHEGLDLHTKVSYALQNFDFDIQKRRIDWSTLKDVTITYDNGTDTPNIVKKVFFKTLPHETADVSSSYKASYDNWQGLNGGNLHDGTDMYNENQNNGANGRRKQQTHNKLQTVEQIMAFRDYVEATLFSDTRNASDDPIYHAVKWKVTAFARKNGVSWGEIGKLFPKETKNDLTGLRRSQQWKDYMDDKYEIIKVTQKVGPGIFGELMSKIEELPRNLITKAFMEMLIQ